MTKWSTLTLGSVEFLEVVGGDLEVLPEEKSEVKVDCPQNDPFSRERSTNWSRNCFSHSKCFQSCLPTSTNHTNHRGKHKGAGKSACHSFKVTTIQVYCWWPSSLSHSLNCSFPKFAAFFMCLIWLEIFYGFVWLGAVENRICCHSIGDSIARASRTVKNLQCFLKRFVVVVNHPNQFYFLTL